MSSPIVLQVQALEFADRDRKLAGVVLNPKAPADPATGVDHAAGVTLIIPLEDARLLYPLGSEHELALIPTDSVSESPHA